MKGRGCKEGTDNDDGRQGMTLLREGGERGSCCPENSVESKEVSVVSQCRDVRMSEWTHMRMCLGVCPHMNVCVHVCVFVYLCVYL